MMVSTHILIGGLIGYSTSLTTGGVVSLVWVGMIGGLIPELDFLIGHHRKTLHYPYSYFLIAIPLAGVYLLSPHNLILMLAVVSLSAGIHSFMDIFAGAELRSWNKDRWQDTAVYDHIRDKWIEPKRIAYGGSRPDLLLSIFSYLIILYFVPNIVIRAVSTLLIAFSITYTLTIKKITEEMIGGEYSTLNGFIRAKLKPNF